MARWCLTHAVGLHARPSVKLTKLAKTFGSTVELALGAERPMDRRQEHRQGHGGQGAAREPRSISAPTGDDADAAVAALSGWSSAISMRREADAANG